MKRLDQQDSRRTVVLTGTRRVGKTIIEYQMIDTLLQRGVAPERIVFISLDHPMLKLSNLSDILDCYHENAWPTQDAYYFFDEIQYASGWDKWLKTIYDPEELDKVVETAVYKHVAAFYYQQATRVGYSRGGPKDKEVDTKFFHTCLSCSSRPLARG